MRPGTGVLETVCSRRFRPAGTPAAALAALGAATTGCGNPIQSVLDPAGLHAARISTLFWVMLAVLSATFVLMLLFLTRALARAPRLEPLADHEHVVALLYLEAPRRVDPSALAVFGVPLAKAALAAASDVPRALDAYLRSTAPEDLQKEQLIRVLAENEWNVARVARVLKVTRRTIYLRMERYGITRKKVPKTVKRTAFA